MNKILLSSIQRLLIFASLVCNISIALGQGEGISNPPHYPIVPQTGNVLIDEKAHNEAKKQWIENYPEEYRKAGGDILTFRDDSISNEKILAKDTLKASLSINSILPTLDAFQQSDFYKLDEIKIIDENNEYTKEQVDEMNLRNHHKPYKTMIVIDWDNKVWYQVDILKDKTVQNFKFQVEGNTIKIENYPQNMVLGDYKVKQINDKELILQVYSYNDNMKFSYQISFLK